MLFSIKGKTILRYAYWILYNTCIYIYKIPLGALPIPSAGAYAQSTHTYTSLHICTHLHMHTECSSSVIVCRRRVLHYIHLLIAAVAAVRAKTWRHRLYSVLKFFFLRPPPRGTVGETAAVAFSSVRSARRRDAVAAVRHCRSALRVVRLVGVFDFFFRFYLSVSATDISCR